MDALEQSTGSARDRGAARDALIAVLGSIGTALIMEPGGFGEAGLAVMIGVPVIGAVGAAVGTYAAPERFEPLYIRQGPLPPSRAGKLSLVVSPGAEVRVHPRAGTAGVVRGRSVTAGVDSIVLARREQLMKFALSDVAQVQVRGGRARSRGMLWGAALGATIGAAVPSHALAKLPAAANGPASTIALNAAIGSAFGLLLAPVVWAPLPLPAGS